jgi:hypothetical protein
MGFLAVNAFVIKAKEPVLVDTGELIVGILLRNQKAANVAFIRL